MTSLALTMPASDSGNEWRRWLFSGVIVVAAHIGLAAAFLQWRDVDDSDFRSAGIVIDLDLPPLAPINAPIENAPVGPRQDFVEEASNKSREQVEEKVDEIVRAPDPDVTAALEPPKPETVTESAEPVPETTAPQPAKRVDSNAIPTWKRQISLLLERNKRYPAAAERHREVGVAQLAFSIDRQGRVMASRIVKSSGSAALDNETLELVKRAQPFPAPPAEVPGNQVEFNVPIRFTDPHAK